MTIYNPCLSADAYTISSDAFASEACLESSSYGLCNRYSPTKGFPDVARDSRMVMYGLSDFIQDKLLKPVTMADVDIAAKFMARSHSFGGSLQFPRELWESIVKDHKGYLPLEIVGIPEGSTFFPNEPYVQVRNTVYGFGEIAAHIEKSLTGKVGIVTACATYCRHWLERMREEVNTDYTLLYGPNHKQNIDSVARFQIHNFGGRACATDEESIILGKAHLLSFYGTDNFDAAFDAWMNGAKDPTGTSILALAHRNVQGHKTQKLAFQAGIDATTGQRVRIISLVADCYDFFEAVKEIIELAKENVDVINVIRPDSGDCYTTLHYIFTSAISAGLYKEINGFKLPTNIKFIYGDSVKPKIQFEVMSKLRLVGMLPTLWGCWGVGGNIRNTPNRDSLSTAYKLSSTEDKLGVVKLSETKTKNSIPYWNHILRSIDYNETVTVWPTHVPLTYDHKNIIEKPYYINGVANKFMTDSFDDIQNRNIADFDNHTNFSLANPHFGLNRENLHSEIIKLQDETFNLYRNRNYEN